MRLTVREKLERIERETLHPRAAFSDASKGRARPEPLDDIRPVFQHDRDRILHSKSFRRLKHKTQVFLAPTGDHYRTRMTHTLEVSQISRTITRALFLNESLTEAIALGHDLGHTPFGHAGERILDGLVSGGFAHVRQSARVVERLEKNGKGLNLTREVIDGILFHSKGKGPVLLDPPHKGQISHEAEVVRISDIIAYVNHDLDDAVRAEIIDRKSIPADILRVLGDSHGSRIDTMVCNVIESTNLDGEPVVKMSPTIYDALLGLRDFLYDALYNHPKLIREFEKSRKIITELYEYFMTDEERFRAGYAPEISTGEDHERAVTDFIAGMTDRYALDLYRNIFLPSPWTTS